jgi:hypothetical protein
MIKAAISNDPDTGTTLSNQEPAYAEFLGLDASIEWWNDGQLTADVVNKIRARRADISRMHQRDLEASLAETLDYVRELRKALDAIALKRRTEKAPLTPQQ